MPLTPLAALCHNCDEWHLPNPCSKSDHLCGQCGHSGHLEFFCPVAPTDRIAYLREQRRLEAPGQRPVNHDLRLPFQGVIPQETMTKIKLDAVKEAFKLLDNGCTPKQVLAFMGGPPVPREPVLMPPGNEGTVLGQLPVVGQPLRLAPMAQLPLNHPAQPTAQQMAHTSTDQHVHKADHGRYAKMHKLFHQGDLAKSIEQERPMDTMPMMDTPSKAPRVPRTILPAAQVTTPTMQHTTPNTQATRHKTKDVGQKVQDNETEQQAMPTTETTDNVAKLGKKEKPKKAIKTEREGTPGGSMVKQGPRCAKCVKSHKRCTHRAQQSPTPQPGPGGSFGVFSATANNIPASDALEGNTPTPQPIPDPSLNEHAAMPTPLTSEKAATTKRKR
ncbi:hypothetical protein MBLNU13_g10042t2 [Cladosporium sp. NU13]